MFLIFTTNTYSVYVPVFSDFTGNDFFKMNESQKNGYILGLIDGIGVHEIIEPHSSPSKTDDIYNRKIYKFKICLRDHFPDSNQLYSIVKVNMDKKPEDWNKPTSFIIMSIFKNLCEERGYL